MRKQRRRNARSVNARFGIMSYEEMIRAEPILATGPSRSFKDSHAPRLFSESAEAPHLSVRCQRLAEGAPLWRVQFDEGAGQVFPGLLGKQYGLLDRRELGTALADVPEPRPYRPPWLSVDFFPRVAPRRLDVLTSILAGTTLGGLQIRPLSIQHQLSRSWPWCTIGRVFMGRGTDFSRSRAGTGVLVGRNLLLTASHLVPWGEPPGNWWMEFVPSYELGAETEPFGRSYVESYRGIRNDLDDADATGTDYVICKLYTPLGDRCGWMGARAWGDEDPYYAGEWTSVGYPETFMSGEWPAVEFAIGIRDIDNDGDGLELETVSFTDHGWSGGPLWGWIDKDPKVIGVCAGREKDVLDPTRSVFAGGHLMVELIKFGIANWS